MTRTSAEAGGPHPYTRAYTEFRGHHFVTETDPYGKKVITHLLPERLLQWAFERGDDFGLRTTRFCSKPKLVRLHPNEFDHLFERQGHAQPGVV